MDAALGESGAERGFRCLKVPNFLVTGFYGTQENPERSDFSNACFAGQALGAERLRMAVRPAGELRLALRSERRLSEGGRLDLGFLGPWAPRVAASTGSHESVEIAVELDDAEIRVLSSVAEILGQEYLQSEQQPETARALEACLEALCRPAAKDGSLVYTAKVIAAVPVIRVRFGTARTNALSLGAASSAFELKQASSDGAAYDIRGKEKLNVAALLEPAQPAFERAATCSRLRDTQTRRRVVGELRQLGLRALAGRDLGSLASAASELRKNVGSSGQAFTDQEQGALLRCLEGLEGASRDSAAQPPTRALCGTRGLLDSVLTGPAENNRLRDVLTDVAQPLQRRLTELANEHALPCAEPVFFRDEDGDGYGNPRSSLRAPKQPAGYVANSLDCYDRSRDARPGQLKFFTRQRGDGSFDYDCDSAQSPQLASLSGGCKSITRFGIPTRCWAEAGWQKNVPSCGGEGRWFATCEKATLSCDELEPQIQQQACR